MDELKKINTKVAVKQIGRLIGGMVFTALGLGLFISCAYQSGITNNQKFTAKAFPDEYAAITEKIIKEFEKH